MEQGIVLSLMVADDGAEALPGCLESAAKYVQQIIIVHDGGDTTVSALAAKFGAVYLACGWRGDFSASCSKALEITKFRWAICLELDEGLAAHLPALLSMTRLLAESGDSKACTAYLRSNPSAVTPQALQTIADAIAASGNTSAAVDLTQEALLLHTGVEYSQVAARALMLQLQELLGEATLIFGTLSVLTGKMRRAARVAERISVL